MVLNTLEAAECNRAFRATLWTGAQLQVTLMEIEPCQCIGLENHPDTDQYLLVAEGTGRICLGECRERAGACRNVGKGYGLLIPAGTWHNVYNTGRCPMKLISVYAPPHHKRGTIHRTKEMAEMAERLSAETEKY